MRARADAQRKEALENTIRQAREREAALTQVLANQRDLLSRGLATRDRVLITENDREQARRDAADAANAINALGVEADERGIRAERDMLDLSARLSQSGRNGGGRGRTGGTHPGARAGRWPHHRTVGGAGRPGERRQQPHALVPEVRGAAGEGLVGILYVPSSEGKKVRPGMPVQVVPSTVNMERDGFIRGEVIRVSETRRPARRCSRP